MSFRCVDGVYLADTARVTGEVVIGKDVSIWYGAVIRGDVAPIEIGEGSNIQDNCVVHCDHGHANRIGKNVVVGHGAILHGVEVGDGSLIGMGAVLLGGTRIGKGCLVAAGAIVSPGTVVPDGSVVMGAPAKVVREVSEKDAAYMVALPPRYVEQAKAYVETPDKDTLKPWNGNS